MDTFARIEERFRTGTAFSESVRIDAPTKEQDEAIVRTVEAFVAGKVEAISVKSHGHNYAGRRIARRFIAEKNKETRKVSYRYEERPLAIEDVVAADFVVPLRGEPFVAVSFADGSSARVEIVKAKATKKESAE